MARGVCFRRGAKQGALLFGCQSLGEVMALASKLGLVATCNSGGAGKWCDEYGEALRGKRVAISAHADDPGRKHAQPVSALWIRFIYSAGRLLMIKLPGKP